MLSRLKKGTRPAAFLRYLDRRTEVLSYGHMACKSTGSLAPFLLR
jgi:hypothetical protein